MTTTTGGDRRGVVTSFDDYAGLGALVDSTDGREYPFHCTAIADGSRTTTVGREVSFRVVARHGGRWEASGIADPASDS